MRGPDFNRRERGHLCLDKALQLIEMSGVRGPAAAMLTVEGLAESRAGGYTLGNPGPLAAQERAMGSSQCFVCQLPFSESELTQAGGRRYCPQCRNIVGVSQAPPEAKAASPAPSGAPWESDRPVSASPKAGTRPRAAPRIKLPLPGRALFYEHSGSIGFLGPILMTSGAIGCAAALGFVYAYLVCWNPFVYFNALACIAFGVLLGLVNAKIAVFGDVRSARFALFMGLLTGLFAVYWVWAIWLRAHASLAVWSPAGIWAAANEISVEGFWSLKGVEFKGFQLKAVWAGEALIILVGSTLHAWQDMSSRAFCERCGEWLETTATVSRLEPIANTELFVSQMLRGDFSPLGNLGAVPAGAARWTKLELLACRKCRGLFCLSVIEVEAEAAPGGGKSSSETSVFDKLLVNAEVHDWARARFLDL